MRVLAFRTSEHLKIDRTDALSAVCLSVLDHIDTLIELLRFDISSCSYLVVAVGLSGILIVKQKLGVTFNFAKQDVIDFTKFSKMTMCRASERNS